MNIKKWCEICHTAQPTEVNFYLVSSSGVRQQWYSLRSYTNEISTILGNETASAGEIKDYTRDVGGLYVNNKKLTFGGVAGYGDRYYERVATREAVNLTVKANNGLATVILRDSDGNVVGVRRGGGIFENVPITQMGENNYQVTVLSAKDSRELELDHADPEYNEKLLAAVAQAEYARTYLVTLDYYAENDASIGGIHIVAAGEEQDAVLVDLGADRGKFWMANISAEADSARYSVGLHNTQQVLTYVVDGKETVMPANGIIAVSGGITRRDFTVTAIDGGTTEHTLYLIHNSASVGTLAVNGVNLRVSGGNYQYSVNSAAKRIRVEATANSELAMVQIGEDGEKVFASAIRDLPLNLTPLNPSVQIPVTVYTYPYDEEHASTSYLTVNRDGGRYAPASAVLDVTQDFRYDVYGRMAFTVVGTTTAELAVETSSYNHRVALYDNMGKEIMPTAMTAHEPENETALGSRDYAWSLSGLEQENLYTLTVFSNKDNGAFTNYPVIIARVGNSVELSALTVDRHLTSEKDLTGTLADGTRDYTVTLDKSLTSAYIYLTTEDPNAVIEAQGQSGIGMLEVKKVLDGSAFKALVTSSDGTVQKVEYTLNIQQSWSVAQVESVVLNGQTLTEVDGVFTYVDELVW